MSKARAGGTRVPFRLVRWALALVAFMPALLALNEVQPAWLDRAVYDLLSREVLPRATQSDQIVFIDIDDGSLQ